MVRGSAEVALGMAVLMASEAAGREATDAGKEREKGVAVGLGVVASGRRLIVVVVAAAVDEIRRRIRLHRPPG